MVGAAFVTHPCRTFFTHWHRLRSGGLVPHTGLFLDRATAEHIPFVFICELTRPGLLIRHMGTGLVDYWDRELTGRYITGEGAYFEAEGFAQCAYIICTHPCGLRQVGQATTAGGAVERFESVVLPLAVDPSKPPRIAVFSRFMGDRAGGNWVKRKLKASVNQWVDIGAGVPNMRPICGERHPLEAAAGGDE